MLKKHSLTLQGDPSHSAVAVEQHLALAHHCPAVAAAIDGLML